MPKLRHPDRSGLHIRVVLDGGVVMGPGRAELLERIRAHGSIAAAGREMGMSYKRAWGLVQDMNTNLPEPSVAADRGGDAGGGARLTPTGDALLALYRRIEAASEGACAHEVEALKGLIARRRRAR